MCSWQPASERRGWTFQRCVRLENHCLMSCRLVVLTHALAHTSHSARLQLGHTSLRADLINCYDASASPMRQNHPPSTLASCSSGACSYFPSAGGLHHLLRRQRLPHAPKPPTLNLSLMLEWCLLILPICSNFSSAGGPHHLLRRQRLPHAPESAHGPHRAPPQREGGLHSAGTQVGR